MARCADHIKNGAMRRSHKKWRDAPIT